MVIILILNSYYRFHTKVFFVTKIIFTLLFLSLQVFGLTITDMRQKSVKIPDNLSRIATIDDGFIEGVLTHLGEVQKVTSIASWSMKRDYKYTILTKSGESSTYRGLNTMKALHPWLNDLPCFNSKQGNVLNYETLIKSNPQLIILRVGDCTVSGANKDSLNKTLKTLESFNIPLVVLFSPTYYKNNLDSMEDEIRILGEIFGKKEQALALYHYLDSIEKMIIERTKKIREKEKVSVLYLGLNPVARKEGGSGIVVGTNTPESYIIEEIANAKNAYRGLGSRVVLSGEQIYALNPDVILLPTHNGYHPTLELYESSYYTDLQGLNAVKNKRVYSLPWTPMNCSRRLEYPLDLLIMAKASYPHLFEDIKVHDFALDFYQKIYPINRQKAESLFKEQLLDWTLKEDF